MDLVFDFVSPAVIAAWSRDYLPKTDLNSNTAAFLVTYIAFLATCLYLMYKYEREDRREMETEPTEDEPSVPPPSRPGKRKVPPRAQELSEECVRVLRAYLRTGVPGVKDLTRVYPAIRSKYHPADPQGWADSCNAAFSGYGRDIQRRLEESEWELDRLDPCELWFVY